MITHHTYSDASPVCKGELWLPEKPVTADTPKIMLIHGGGWWHGTADFMAGVADRFCREGYIVFNIDYRVTTEAPWPACGDDCLAAADFFVRADAEEIRVTAGKPIVVCGVSAGGHLALMTGLRMPREQVLGIISIAGIADPDTAGRVDADSRRERPKRKACQCEKKQDQNFFHKSPFYAGFLKNCACTR